MAGLPFLAISTSCLVPRSPKWLEHYLKDHRHALQKKLATHRDSYKAGGSKIINFEKIKDHYAEAKAHAEQLIADHKRVGEALANPSTTIFRLLDGIIKHGKHHQ